jgi:hypothetical protein
VSPGAKAKTLFAAAAVVVAATVVAAITVLGGPNQQRRLRLDSVRVENLQSLGGLIGAFLKAHQRLPESLDELAREPGYQPPLRDPAAVPYSYERTSPETFRLCATFEVPSEATASDLSPPYNWVHQGGRQCFERRGASFETADLRVR